MDFTGSSWNNKNSKNSKRKRRMSGDFFNGWPEDGEPQGYDMSDLIERLRGRVRMLATPAGGDIVVKLFPKEVIEIADALEAKDAEIERLRAVLQRIHDKLLAGSECRAIIREALAALEDSDE
jgi:hypothetical protein